MSEEIKGHRELSENELQVINDLKDMANVLGDYLADINQTKETLEIDQRWLAIGKTHLQEGFMALTRAIAKPKGF